MTFGDIRKYLIGQGLNNEQFCISEDIENIEFYTNRFYFCSVGRWNANSFEVFELHHGAEVSEDGRQWLTDGTICQYKVYKSLKRAIDFAIACLKNKELPENAIREW